MINSNPILLCYILLQVSFLCGHILSRKQFYFGISSNINHQHVQIVNYYLILICVLIKMSKRLIFPTNQLRALVHAGFQETLIFLYVIYSQLVVNVTSGDLRITDIVYFSSSVLPSTGVGNATYTQFKNFSQMILICIYPVKHSFKMILFYEQVESAIQNYMSKKDIQWPST